MSRVPVGWSQASLANLVAPDGLFSDGDWVESKDQDPSGSIRLLQLADIGDGVFLDRSRRFVNEAKFEELRCTELREGDVLVARMPDPLGRACLMPRLPQRCITVVDVAVIRPGRNAVSPEWLKHFVNSPEIRQTIDLLSSGTTRKRISRKNLGEIEFPVPPLNEQNRIADKLDALLARVDTCRGRLDRVPLILKQFRQAVLAAATSGRLTEEWRQANEQEISEWSETTIGEIAEVFLGRQRSPENHFGPHMRRYVRAANVTWNGWDFSDFKEMNFDPRDFERYRLQVGDILLNEGSGSADEVGKPAIWSGEIEDCCFQNTLLCVRPYETSSKYLYFALLHAARSRAFVKDTRGVNIFHIGKEKLAAFGITLPPLAEQHEIVQRVEALFVYADRLEDHYRAARALVERLTPSLLAKAFRGELVPQDPDDEPASVLLERIRAERASAAAQPKQPRRRPAMEQKTTTRKIPAGSAGIVQALHEAGRELSGKDLFAAAGYPPDADAESVEAFFVAVREALRNEEITKTRRNDMDWFSLALR